MKNVKLSDKTQLILYSSLAAVMFLIAALVPLKFRGQAAEPVRELSPGERAAIFSVYWNTADSERAQLREDLTPDKEELAACTAKMEEIVSRCLLDRQDWQTETEGSEYFSLVSESGTVKVCRKWLQCQGDWRNWVDVCFDMDSGQIYYLYTSSECVANSARYTKALPKAPDAESVAGSFAESQGFELLYLDWTGEAADAAAAVYTSGASALRMSVSCIYYPATLIDVLIRCDM